MRKSFTYSLIFTFCFSALAIMQSFGAVTISAPSLTVYACSSFPTPYSTLGDIVITENVKDDIVQGNGTETLILTVPTNFEFEAGTGTVTESVGDDVTAVTMVVTATTITVSITTNGGGTSLTDIITISGIKVRGMVSASGPSNVTRTGGTQTIVGDVVTDIHATLTSAVGGPSPTTSAAGSDQMVVASTTTMAANNPSVGTGNWSLVSGAATITTPTSETSGITALTGGASATLRWTISNNGCESSDDVIITRYCTASYTVACGGGNNYISLVDINTLNNVSTCADTDGNAWTVYSSPTTTLTPNTNYDITVNTDISAIVSVWIDFDQSGTFDASEWTQVYTTGTSGTVSVAVPAGATIGETQMRIRTRNAGFANGSGDACTNMGSGETEDYIVTICGATPPTDPTTTAASRCGTGTVGLSASGSGGGEDYLWYDAATGGTLLQTNGSSYTTASISTTTTYYVTIYNTSTTCAESGRIAVIATVNGLPTITGQPGSTSACATGEATFTVTATGAGLTYQWQEDDGGGFTNITNGGIYAGATSLSLTMTGVTAGMDTYKYQCVVTGTCTPTATTDGSATLTIDAGTAPTTADAGLDKSVNVATATLGGNTITVGSGLWTLVSGTATITTDTDPNSGITGLAAAPSVAVLRWTSTNGGCSTQDDMSIIRYCLGTHSTNPGCDYAIDISNVVVSDISNSSSCPNSSPNNYTDFTNVVGSVEQGTNYAITITRGGTVNGTWWGIWVDWNKDGDYLDGGEFMAPIESASGTSSGSGTLVVPASQNEDTYTMRIRAKNTTTMAQATVCDAYGYGEIEDYTLKVAPSHCFNSTLDASNGEISVDCGGPCNTAVAGTVTGGGTFACGASWTLTSSGSAGEVQWQYSLTNADPWYDIANETGTTYSDVSNATTYFRVKVSGGSCAAVYSSSATITISANPTLYWRTSGGTTTWGTATNWWTTPTGPTTAGAAPTSCDNAVIQPSTNDPSLGVNGVCGDLTVQSGAILNLTFGNNKYLTVSGNIVNDGSIVQSTASTVRGIELAGVNTTWGGSSNSYTDLSVKIADNSNVTLTADATINAMDAKKVAFGGTLNLDTYTLKITADFDQSGAILHVNTGTLWLAITTTMTIDPSALESDFGTVFFDVSGNWSINLTSGGSANIGYYNKKFRSISGTFTIQSDRTIRNNFIIKTGGGTVRMDPTTPATTSVNGHFVNNDNDGTPFTAGVSTINMNGTVAQDITGAAPTTFNNLTINNTSSTGVSVLRDAIVTNTLTLTDGHLIADATDRLTLGSACTVSPASGAKTGSAESFVSGHLSRDVASNTTEYGFPMGNSAQNEWRPVSISPRDGAANTWKVEMLWSSAVTDVGSSDILSGELLTSINSDYYYDLTYSTLANIDWKCYYTATDITSWGTDESTMVIGHWDAGASIWDNWSKNAGSDWARDASANWIEVLDVGVFSPGGPGDGDGALPIELLYFDAVYNTESKKVDLEWETTSETNNEFFTVEKSSDLTDFDLVASVQGAGNSNQLLHYTAVDEYPEFGLIYYRLKQTDYDGQFEYSDLVAVNIVRKLEFSVLPNPAHNFLEIRFDNISKNASYTTTPENDALISIYDSKGRLVYGKRFGGSFNKFNVDISNLDRGLYVVNLILNGENKSAKFIKE